MKQEFTVKGLGLSSTRKYVRTKFPNDYRRWVDSLPPKSKELYTNTINATDWYPVEDAYYHPLKQIAKLFFKGSDKDAALDIGNFSAEFALKGVYKVFLMIASPQYLMKVSKRVITKYYNPVDVHIDEVKKYSLVLSTNRIHNSDILEYRTIGWCITAMALAGCKNVKFKYITDLYDGMFSFRITWE